jgi:hypothetical protein
MLSIDNSVELMIKTFLGLPERETGIRLPRKQYEELSESFPRLLDAIHEHAPDKVREYNISEIEWYHRLRNQLYHLGNGLTVERQKVVAYAEIARGLFRQLFGQELPEIPTLPPLGTPEPPGPRADSAKGWFLIDAKRDGKKYFAATVNAKGSCSLRTFDAETGRFLNKRYSSGNYQDAFREILSGARRLSVQPQPSLERDCRLELPFDVLQQLKRQL